MNFERLIAEGITPSGVFIPSTAAQKKAARDIKKKVVNNKSFNKKDILALAPYIKATIPYI